MLVSNEAELRSALPNTFTTVEGELSLYDKIYFYLLAAERWLQENIVGTEMFLILEAKPADDPVRRLAAQVVMLEALSHAVPSLDVVLTPNGFGIVSNNNIAPASKERIERLVQSLMVNRDDCIQALLLELATVSTWRQSPRGQWFAKTLFPNLQVVTLAGYDSDKWRHYQRLRQQIIAIEQEFADKYISEQLISQLRTNLQKRALTPEEAHIVEQLRACTLEVLGGADTPKVRLVSLVNYIRTNATTYAVWQYTDTARLYENHAFQNEKHSGGYFFG